MVPVGSKAKRLVSVNNTTTTIHHYHHLAAQICTTTHVEIFLKFLANHI